jgi:acyl-CoA thioesterase
VGNLEVDTRVEGSGGLYRGTLSPDWEAWGPNGGYLSAVVLRAAGEFTPLSHPASFNAHYLNPASFGPVELNVTALRSSKRAESLRVEMRQRDVAIMHALVWVTEELEGLQHDVARMPEAPPPEGATLWSHNAPLPIWRNIEGRMVGWPEGQVWEERTAGAPERLDWFRFEPQATFEDPFVDAGRSLVLIDTMMYSAAALAYEEPMRYVAPSLDLSVQFHRPARDHEWLLCEAHSDVAERGLVAGTARLWTGDGRLIASGAQQMFSRPLPD